MRDDVDAEHVISRWVEMGAADQAQGHRCRRVCNPAAYGTDRPSADEGEDAIASGSSARCSKLTESGHARWLPARTSELASKNPTLTIGDTLQLGDIDELHVMGAR